MSFTSVTLSGTIKKDAEQKFTPNNNAVINFTMNILRYDGRTKEEKAYPVKVTLWGDTFTDMLPQLKAGARVLVTGRLQMDQFNDRNGKMVRLLNVEATRVHLIDQLASVSSAAMEAGGMDFEPAPGETDAINEEVPF